MPQIVTDDGVSLNYRFDGPEDAPALILSNSLGTNLEMWEPQMPALVQRYRVLRYDTRGHGQSGVPTAPYQVDRLGKDVLDLMDSQNIRKALFCGLSMGGMTGMWLGVNAPQRFARLALCNTAARIGTAEVWNTRIAAVQQGGTSVVVQGVIQRWFTEGFTKARPAVVDRIAAMLLATPAAGYMAACGAVRDMDQRDSIAAIRLPTLVIAGAEDTSTPPQDGRFVADAIPGARYIELPAAHLSNVEVPEDFTRALTGFLAS